MQLQINVLAGQAVTLLLQISCRVSLTKIIDYGCSTHEAIATIEMIHFWTTVYKYCTCYPPSAQPAQAGCKAGLIKTCKKRAVWAVHSYHCLSCEDKDRYSLELSGK